MKQKRGVCMSGKPELSVIIVSYNARKTIEDCLGSLEEQETSKAFEVILVDSSTDDTASLVENQFPNVKLRRFSERKFPGDARNIGISMAMGKIIAFIDADCRAEPNWIEEIVNAHQSPHIAIGGAVGNANPESYVGWAAYFSELSRWMPETQHQWMDDIGAGIMSYKREIFDQYGGFTADGYGSDTDFHWRLEKHGQRLRFVPSILVSHHNHEDFGVFLRHAVFHGRNFARVRIRSEGFSTWKRLAYVFFSPLIPVRIFSKICLNNIKNRVYFDQFLKASPLLALGVICWSLGEVIGYARG